MPGRIPSPNWPSGNPSKAHVDKFGSGKHGYRNEDVSNPATECDAIVFNSLQENIVRVVEAAGLTPDNTDGDANYNQLTAAIVALIEAGLLSNRRGYWLRIADHSFGERKALSGSGTITDIDYNADGTKLYQLRGTTIYQHPLSVPYDVTSAGASEASFSVATQESAPKGMRFGDGGTKLYVCGSGAGGDIWQYTLSTPYDLTSASYASKTKDVSAQDNTPTALLFNDDGSKLLMAGDQNNYLYLYTLSTPWDISTASNTGTNTNTASIVTSPRGLARSADHEKVFVCGSDGSKGIVAELTHESVADDFTSLAPTGATYSYSPVTSAFEGILFNADGTRMVLGYDVLVMQMTTGAVI